MLDELVIARCFAIALAGFENQWSHTREAVNDIITRQRMRQIAVGGAQQILGFVLGDVRRFRGVDVTLGGADQREIIFIGDDEDDAAIGLLEHEGIAAEVNPAGDDVRSLYQPKRRCIVAPEDAARDAFGPGPGGVDDAGGAQRPAIAQRYRPDTAIMFGANSAGARQDQAAAVLAILEVGDDQPGVVDPSIPIAKTASPLRRQRTAGAILPQIDAFRARDNLTACKVIIQEQPGAQHPFGPLFGRMRQHETLRPADLRRDIEQHLAFGERLAHQPEGVEFEVSQPAVDELCRRARRRAAEIAGLDDRDRQATAGRVTGDPGAIDAAADDQQVVHPVKRGRRNGHRRA